MAQVLDHGYLNLIHSWGSDITIIESARMSTNKGFQGWKNDQKLLKYLWDNKHHTPFEFCGMTIEVKAPIMVFREWHRHRTQSYNEMSARYTPVPNDNYVPDIDNLTERCHVATTNKQAKGLGNNEPTSFEISSWLEDLRVAYEEMNILYQGGLQIGIPKELARCCMPVGRYSKMRATANLRNWLAFLTLRMAPNAQWEIRQYANAVGELVKNLFPRTWELFSDE